MNSMNNLSTGLYSIQTGIGCSAEKMLTLAKDLLENHSSFSNTMRGLALCKCRDSGFSIDTFPAPIVQILKSG